MALERLVERSLATTFVTALIVSLPVQQTPGSLAFPVTQLPIFKLTLMKVLMRNRRLESAYKRPRTRVHKAKESESRKVWERKSATSHCREGMTAPNCARWSESADKMSVTRWKCRCRAITWRWHKPYPNNGHVNDSCYKEDSLTKTVVFMQIAACSTKGKQSNLPCILCKPGNNNFSKPEPQCNQFLVKAFVATICKKPKINQSVEQMDLIWNTNVSVIDGNTWQSQNFLICRVSIRL